MNNILCPLANTLWYLSNLPESLAFRLARRDVAGAQANLLLRLLRRNAHTDFGRRFDFASIRSVAEYQQRVPLSTYDDYRQAIEAIGAGRPQVLTQEPVLLLEPTSGSTAATKHIPYTAALKAEFQRAIAPWMVNLFY
ncbi:MAG: GH3 auxin-responsive promoter family protein, partial [Chloroflexi bacterium]|nr:GH3 auxin-responsive promoter family protein [Chloroflexota bacterium]